MLISGKELVLKVCCKFLPSGKYLAWSMAHTHFVDETTRNGLSGDYLCGRPRLEAYISFDPGAHQVVVAPGKKPSLSFS